MLRRPIIFQAIARASDAIAESVDRRRREPWFLFWREELTYQCRRAESGDVRVH